MSPHENQAIAELTAEVRGYRQDIAVLHTKLFGDEKSENPKGRIPLIEARQIKTDKRLTRIEHVGWMAAGAGWLVAFCVASVKAIYYTLSVMKGH